MDKMIRYNHISVAKGVGIIMVVIAHSFPNPNTLTNFISLFHMPLFFFLSGYCFKDKYIDSKWEYIKRSISTLYVPFVIANLIFILLHNVFFDLNIYNDSYGFKDSVSKRYEIEDYVSQIYYTIRFMGQEQLLGGFWFLNCLFFARMIFLLLRSLQSKIKSDSRRRLFTAIFLLLAVVFCLLGLRIPGLLSSREVFGFILLWFGYMFKRYEGTLSQFLNIATVLGFVVCVIYAKFRPLYYNGSPLTWDRADYIIPCVLGCLMVYNICRHKWVSECRSLIYVGSHTLIILALHFLAFKPISLLYITLTHSDVRLLAQFAVLQDTPAWMWIPYTLAGGGIPLIINYLYRRIYEGFIYRIGR